MSNNGDFYAGYAAGQGAIREPDVDIQSYINHGLEEGSAAEYAHQSWYVQRLARSLAARNSQKQALLQELRKYAPDHPYLNELVVENKASNLTEDDYIRVTNKINSDQASLLLVVQMGGGIVTEGDLAMEAAGAAFTELTTSSDFEENLKLVLYNINPPFIERNRRDLARAAAEKARVAKAKKEASEAKFADIMKPASNFMGNIFGKN